MSTQDILPIILTVLFIALMGYAIFLLLPSQEKMKKLFEDFTENQKERAESSEASIRNKSLSAKLKRAGINMYPAVFKSLCILMGLFVIVVVYLYTDNIAAGIILSYLGYEAPYWFLNFLNKSYDKKMEMQLEILLTTTSQTIVTSGSMIKTLESNTRVIGNPLRSELNKILGGHKLNKPLEKSFADLAVLTGKKELVTYGKIASIAVSQGTSAAAESFTRLTKAVEMERGLALDKKAQLGEYTMFVSAMIIGLPVAYIVACSFFPVARESLISWFPGKITTAGICLLIMGSYLGFKASTKE